ncbi:MAG TPA: alkaline phosphatase family protein [Acidobacteriota bacterium]|nr:alkaline phosphatase family protein [Acidobacteriota bacterium]
MKISVKPLLTLLLALAFALQPAAAQVSRQDEPGRLVMIKCDGLPPDLLAAVAFPEREDLLARLPYAKDLKQALTEYQRQSGRQIVLPNIRKFFYQDGVVADNMYSHTLTLSAVAWGVIETGLPSIIKGHGVFSRDTCHLRSHLDGLRDTIDQLKVRVPYGESRTAATWRLDQVGVPFIFDYYDPLRSWQGPHIYRRSANRELLLEGGKRWLTADGEGALGIARSHVSRFVTGIDYTEFNQEMSAQITAEKILEKDLQGDERFDFVSPLFTLMDHQQHVDPHPVNLIHWLTVLDREVGQIFRAVAESERRDHTVVAITSDHGSEIKPGQVGYSFPITKVFRTRQYGGHTVKTLLVEAAWSALSVPIPGMDRPRIYESEYSPYNRGPAGQDGYVTAYIDPFGNGRAATYLRNDDLNRLHLLLMELKNKPDAQKFERLRSLFSQTLDATRAWLEPDLRLLDDYLQGAADLAQNLAAKADRQSFDQARRLRAEINRNRPQVEALQRLLSVTFDKGLEGGLYFDQVFSGEFKIEDFLPKQYMGVANSVHQLSRYTLGLDDDLQWISHTVDPQGQTVPMDYFQLLRDYQAPNAPVNGDRNPYDLVVTPLDVENLRPALRDKKLVEGEDRLRAAAWILSTAKGNPSKGGSALAVKTQDGRIQYIPIAHLEQDADGRYRFDLNEGKDPLGLLHSDSGFRPPRPGPAQTVAGASDASQASGRASRSAAHLAWMRALHPARQWLEAAHATEYSVAPNIILDLIDDAVAELVGDPEFQKYLIEFSSPEMKQRYLRGLKRKYASLRPDFIIWAEELWNFNSKARTSGGNHSGLRPMVTRTVFGLWGGKNTGIAQGRTVREIHTTIDLVPTLLATAGLLDEEGRPVVVPGALRERAYRILPGQVIDVWKEGRKPSVFQSRDGDARKSSASPETRPR